MNPKSNWEPRQYFLPRDYSLEDVFGIVELFLKRRSQYDILFDYYIGKHDILYRNLSDPSKPNNKVVNNFSKHITDTTTSYFLGSPITYTSQNEEGLSLLEEELTRNNSNNVDSELAKLTSIYGHAFEIHYINSDGCHMFKHRSPKDVLAIYSADLDEELILAVNISITKDFKTNKEIQHLEIYTDSTIERYRKEGIDGHILIESNTHPFGKVPVIEFLANEERQGDSETVLTQINAYNIAVSDSVNDISYWNDAYLLLRNLAATDDDDIQEMKQNRVILVDGEGDAEFIVKNVNDTHVENIKDRLVQDIHKFSSCPNLSDEKFASNLSGLAIRFKMMSLEAKCAIRERKFTLAIQKRIALLSTTLGIRNGEVCQCLDQEVKPVFVRNLPANIVELADSAVKLRGIVSAETLRAQIPFVVDLIREAELIEAEELRQLQMDLFGTTTTTSTNENDGMNDHNLQMARSPYGS